MISEYFTDEELESQLRLQFDEEEMWTINFKVFFNQIVDRGDDLFLEIKGRRFSIDRITGDVTEVL